MLPFANRSGDPDQQHFSDGITEDILIALARSRHLEVRPRSSSFALKDAGLDLQTLGRRLNVTHVLVGSVRSSGSRIRITAELSHVGTNQSIWSDRFERELTEVFEVQDALVEDILAALDVEFVDKVSRRHIPDIDAYKAALLGRDHLSRFEVSQAERWLSEAVKIDPDYAEAWAYRAQNIAGATAFGFSPNTGASAERMQEFLDKAIELDPTNTDALATRALMDTFYSQRRYEDAINELVELITSQPNNVSGHFYLAIMYMSIGRPDLYAKVSNRLAELSPESMNHQVGRVGAQIWQGEYESAASDVEKFERRFSYPLLGLTLAAATGDVVELERKVNQAPIGWSSWESFYKALVPYLKGDFQAAMELASPTQTASAYLPHYSRFLVALLKQDIDEAFLQYNASIEAAEPAGIQSIQGRADLRRTFPEFFSDPRYNEMLQKYGLDPASVAKMSLADLPF